MALNLPKTQSKSGIYCEDQSVLEVKDCGLLHLKLLRNKNETRSTFYELQHPKQQKKVE